jgi:KaiC/GvpD/RAD55 family RecA-like ATPase
MRKIKSGVYGLNPLLDGGLNENSITVIIGTSGTGKTTLGTQFIRRGLEVGNDAVFVSLDENQEQIIREAIAMGWTDIHKYIENKKLVFIDASGKKFSEFIMEELPDFVDRWHGVKSRIVIDPLTPVIWAVEDQYQQRELLSILMKETRKVGTVICTLEEHGTAGRLTGKETVIPMYLADSVVHLKYIRKGGQITRNLEIIKCRSSKHSSLTHEYKIIKGLGLVVEQSKYNKKQTRTIPSRLNTELKKRKEYLPRDVYMRIGEAFRNLFDDDIKGVDPSEILANILEDYSEID